MSDRETPLIDLAAERTREIAARCRTVERACRAIGFRADSSHERVATLVARLAGGAVLRRTVAEIAGDRNVGCSERQAKRAIEELVEYDVIECDVENVAPTHRRGRPAKVMLLRLRMDAIRSVVAEANRWEAEHRGEVVKIEAMTSRDADSDFSASVRREVGTCPADSRHMSGETPAKDRQNDDHSVLAHNANTSSPSPSEFAGQSAAAAKVLETESESDWDSITDSVRDAGCERVRQLVREARSAGLTAGEVAEAAFVVRHSSKLSGGALFDWVRSGHWPASGIRTAEEIRDRRAKWAVEIRETASRDAPPGASDQVVRAVAVGRLLDRGLSEQVTAEERALHAEWVSHREANQCVGH